MTSTKIITLHIGGEVFKTTSTTLQTLPHTLLAELTNPILPVNHVTCAKEYHWKHVNKKSSLSALGSLEFVHPIRISVMSTGDENDKVSIASLATSYRDYFKFEQGGHKPRSSYIHLVDTNANTAKPLSTIRSNISNILTNANGSVPRRDSVFIPSRSSVTNLSTKSTDTDDKLQHPLLNPSQSEELFFDRNPVIMPYILDAYRLGQLHLPVNMCSMVIREELKFWKIPEDMISECCWKTFHDGLNSMTVVNKINVSFDDPYMDFEEKDELPFHTRVWLTMERPNYNSFAKVWAGIYYSMMILSLLVFMLLTVSDLTEIKPEFEQSLESMQNANQTVMPVHLMVFTKSISSIAVSELITRIFFTLEYIVRALCCPDKGKFFCNSHNILDLAILVVVWLRFLVDIVITNNTHHFNFSLGIFIVILDCSRALLALRVVHLAKHMKEMKIMYLSARASIRELLLLVIIMLSAAMLFGTVIFLSEALEMHTTEPLAFPNIPIAAYWAVITMTTVGYGDYVPISTSGRIVASMCAIAGLLLVAMPIAIIASNFSSYYGNLTSGAQRLRRRNIMAQIRLLLSRKEKEGTLNVSTPVVDDAMQKSDSLDGVKNETFVDDDLPKHSIDYMGSGDHRNNNVPRFTTSSDEPIQSELNETSTEKSSREFPKRQEDTGDSVNQFIERRASIENAKSEDLLRGPSLVSHTSKV